jgi:hypothetical protein
MQPNSYGVIAKHLQRDFGQPISRSERPTAARIARFELPSVRFQDCCHSLPLAVDLRR